MILMEEEVGFEPTEELPSIVFKTISLNRSDILPCRLSVQAVNRLSDLYCSKTTGASDENRTRILCLEGRYTDHCTTPACNGSFSYEGSQS